METKLSVTAILVRGLSRQAGHWHPFDSILAQRPGIEDVIALDLPGFGSESGQTAPRSIEITVDLLDERLMAKSVPGPKVLVAISLGGMIAHCWAQKHTERFDRIVLINSSLKGLSRIDERLTPRAWMDLIRMFGTRDVERREQLVFDLVSNTSTQRKQVVDEWVALDKKYPLRKEQVANQLVAAATYSPSKDWQGPPALVIGSKLDRMVSWCCSEAIHSTFGFDHVYHPTAGHDIPIDEPEWLADSIATWLQAGSLHAHEDGPC